MIEKNARHSNFTLQMNLELFCDKPMVANQKKKTEDGNINVDYEYDVTTIMAINNCQLFYRVF